EQGSEQRLDRLLEEFFDWQSCKGNVAMHAAKLQKHFLEINDALVQQKETPLSERILIARILSTLGSEFQEFRNVWEAMPSEARVLGTLIEKLRTIEQRS